MRRLLDLIESAAGLLGALIVAGFTGIMLVDVVARYVLAISLPWAPELSILLFQMASFVGAAIALRRGMHFGLGLVLPFNGDRAKQMVAVFVGVVILACSLYLVRYGWALMLMTRASTYSTLPFSHNVIYVGLMVGSALMAIFALEQIGKAIFSPQSLSAAHTGDHAAIVPKDQ